VLERAAREAGAERVQTVGPVLIPDSSPSGTTHYVGATFTDTWQTFAFDDPALRQLGSRNYLVTGTSGCGGLIQTADGNAGGCGMTRTKRSGWTAYAPARRSIRRSRIAVACP
jgi:hypothetical protein